MGLWYSLNMFSKTSHNRGVQEIICHYLWKQGSQRMKSPQIISSVLHDLTDSEMTSLLHLSVWATRAPSSSQWPPTVIQAHPIPVIELQTPPWLLFAAAQTDWYWRTTINKGSTRYDYKSIQSKDSTSWERGIFVYLHVGVYTITSS